MKQDAYRTDGTFHSRIYRDNKGTRYLSRHFNEKGDLYSICNYDGDVLHGRCRMYCQAKDVEENVAKGIKAIKYSNMIAQTTWHIHGVQVSEQEWKEYEAKYKASV